MQIIWHTLSITDTLIIPNMIPYYFLFTFKSTKPSVASSLLAALTCISINIIIIISSSQGLGLVSYFSARIEAYLTNGLGDATNTCLLYTS